MNPPMQRWRLKLDDEGYLDMCLYSRHYYLANHVLKDYLGRLKRHEARKLLQSRTYICLGSITISKCASMAKYAT
jgi:hypothetical protein